MRQLSGVQIVFAVILAVALMLAVSFSGRITASREVNRIHDKIVQEIELLKMEQTELLARLEYVNSDAFVEAWARSEGKMIRENEVLIIPKPSNILLQTAATPQISVPIQTSLPEPEKWELWWQLFFDSEPPDF
jgi:cell division protein FtsB